MNTTQKVLVTLLSEAIQGNKISTININDINWKEVFDEADAHAILPLVYPIVENLKNTCKIGNKLMTEWRKITMNSVIYQTQHINQMKFVFNVLKEANIPVIALKGLVIRELYPCPEARTMSDSDLLIKKEDLESAENALYALGYTKIKSISHESSFVHDSAFPIDLHWCLINKNNLKNTDPFENTIWQNVKLYNFYGVNVLALSREYELMHLFFHIASHIISSGFGIRLICDIVLFVEHEKKNINWNLIYNLGEACNLNRLISIILILCNDLFGSYIPTNYENNYCGTTEYVKILINEIFNSGIYGHRDEIRIANTRMLNHVLQSNNDVSKIKLIIRYIFPSNSKLDKRYSYASKYPILLVFAWLHRFAFELYFNGFNRLKELFKIKSTASFVKNRFELIKWLEL